MTQPSRGQAEAATDADDAAVIQLSRHEPEYFTAVFRRHAPYIQRYVVRRLGRDVPARLPAAGLLRPDPLRRPALVVRHRHEPHRPAPPRRDQAVPRAGPD